MFKGTTHNNEITKDKLGERGSVAAVEQILGWKEEAGRRDNWDGFQGGKKITLPPTPPIQEEKKGSRDSLIRGGERENVRLPWSVV